MVGKLRIHEFMVLTSGGVPIFHYSPDGTRKLDELLSGFLTAITSFATEFGERSVQSLSFEGSELLYEQGEECIFIFLCDANAPKNLLRAVLQDLSQMFMNRYKNDVKGEIHTEDKFRAFEKDVRSALAYYEGVLLIASNLSPFAIPSIKDDSLSSSGKNGSVLDQFHRDYGAIGDRVLGAIDGQAPIHEISETLGLDSCEISDVIEYLAIWGVLKVSKMCPKIRTDDTRFDAYLDLVGLPSKDYQLLERAKPLCNGSRSIEEISERLGVTAERLHDVLMKLGDEVNWTQTEVTGLAPIRDRPS